MKVADLYQYLCWLYGIKTSVDIDHYLILSNSDICETVIGNRNISREALLIRQSGDDLEVGLFIDPSIVNAIKCFDVFKCTDALACAIEGVSHFLYVLDRAQKGRCLSKLEIELQGEVDKFLLLQLIAAKREPHRSLELFAKQFEHHVFDVGLTDEDADRYATASHFAAKYCNYIRTRCFNPLRISKLMILARDFFERDLSSKITRLIP